MAHYINWADAKQYLDQEMLGTAIDIRRLQLFAEVHEKEFDAEMRRMYDVPFDEATDPEAFALAKTICGMRTAANYLRWSQSAEGNKDEVWWPDELDRKAQKLVEQLLMPGAAPEDADLADDPLQFVPYDGAPDHPAVFKRANVTTGSTHW